MTKVCPITIGFSSLFVILSSFFPQEINKNNPNIKINIDLNNLFIKTFPLSFIFYFSTLFPTIFPTSAWLPIRDLPFLWTTSLPALLNLSTLSVFFLHRSFYNLPPFLHFVSTLLRPWQQ